MKSENVGGAAGISGEERAARVEEIRRMLASGMNFNQPRPKIRLLLSELDRVTAERDTAQARAEM